MSRFLVPRLVVLVLIFLVAAAVGAPAQDRSSRRGGTTIQGGGTPSSPRDRETAPARPGQPQGGTLGVQVGESPTGFGVLVIQVQPGTPAEAARLQAGDVLTSVNGTELPHPRALARLWALTPPGGTATFEVLREGNTLTVQVTRTAAPGAGAVATNALLQKAAGPTEYQVPTSPTKRLAEFNTLETVILDRTGRVHLLGTYDPTYATGPIPYPALLGEALARPEPALSLDSANDPQEDASFRRLLDEEAPRIANDPAYGMDWVNRVMDLLWDAPNLEADRTAFAGRLQEACGINREEFEAFRSWRKTDGRNTPRAAREYYRKFYAAGGAPGVGAALACMNLFRESNEFFVLVLAGRELGREAEVQALVDQIQALPPGNARLGPVLQMFSILYDGLFTGLGAPPAETRALLDRFRSGQASEADVHAVLGEHTNRFLGETMGRKVLHGLNLSQDLLGQLYRLPPARARVNTFGAPLDSATMRVFFRADYALKGVCAAGGPDGLPSDAAFFFDELTRSGGSARVMPELLRVRYWLVPDQVQMQVSPDGSVVRFGKADITLRSEVLEAPTADAAGLSFVQGTSALYASQVTSRYDALARRSPSFHALREGAKVIALARWARANGISLQVAASGPPEPALPATVPGLWGATFLVSEGQGRNELQFWRGGGVSFQSDEGTAWVQARPDAAVSGDVLQQLAASTVLAERAANAARGGNLEAARDLAERSAQAMVGSVPSPPEPGVAMAVGTTPAGAADVSQAAVEALDANLQALTGSQAALQAAEPLQATSPEEYARAVQASQQSAERAQANLQRLQAYLQAYRQAPGDAEEVAVQLEGLKTPGATAAPDGAASAAPGGHPGHTGDQPSSTPANVTPGPTREEMQQELEGLRADLARLTEVQSRLTRTILQDVAQYEDWAAEVERSYARSRSNLQGLIENEVLYHAKRFLRLRNAPKADQEAIKRLGEFVALRDVVQWGQEQQKDWEWVGKGIVMLAGAAGLDEEINRVLVAGSGLIDASKDLTTCYLAWRGMDRLKGNPAAFEAANQASMKAMREMIARIRELELRLRKGGR